MPKKTIPKPEEHLEAPAGVEVTPEAVQPKPPALVEELTPDDKWPQATERVDLIVAFDEADKAKIMDKVAELVSEKEQYKADAKSEASRLKGLIDGVDAKISKFSSAVRQGGEEQPVECVWKFECSGLDASGHPIRHPQYKALFRTDTREFVRATLITDEERQMNLAGVVEPGDCDDCAPETAFGAKRDGDPLPSDLIYEENDGTLPDDGPLTGDEDE